MDGHMIKSEFAELVIEIEDLFTDIYNLKSYSMDKVMEIREVVYINGLDNDVQNIRRIEYVNGNTGEPINEERIIQNKKNKKKVYKDAQNERDQQRIIDKKDMGDRMIDKNGIDENCMDVLLQNEQYYGQITYMIGELQNALNKMKKMAIIMDTIEDTIEDTIDDTVQDGGRLRKQNTRKLKKVRKMKKSTRRH